MVRKLNPSIKTIKRLKRLRIFTFWVIRSLWIGKNEIIAWWNCPKKNHAWNWLELSRNLTKKVKTSPFFGGKWLKNSLWEVQTYVRTNNLTFLDVNYQKIITFLNKLSPWNAVRSSRNAWNQQKAKWCQIFGFFAHWEIWSDGRKCAMRVFSLKNDWKLWK